MNIFSAFQTEMSNQHNTESSGEKYVLFNLFAFEKHINVVKNLKKLLFQGNHPNTYTLTKAMAESVVLEYCQSTPTAIVRPSIGKQFCKKLKDGINKSH